MLIEGTLSGSSEYGYVECCQCLSLVIFDRLALRAVRCPNCRGRQTRRLSPGMQSAIAGANPARAELQEAADSATEQSLDGPPN